MSPQELKTVELAAEVLDGGEALRSFNSALAEIARDVLDRPNVQMGRTATLKVSIKPVIQESGAMRPEIKYQVASHVPPDVAEVSAFNTRGSIVVYETPPEQLSLIEAKKNIRAINADPAGTGKKEE